LDDLAGWTVCYLDEYIMSSLGFFLGVWKVEGDLSLDVYITQTGDVMHHRSLKDRRLCML
jgi:hypothetical protein